MMGMVKALDDIPEPTAADLAALEAEVDDFDTFYDEVFGPDEFAPDEYEDNYID